MGARERLPVHLVGEHHVVQARLLDGEVVDVGLLGRDELDRVRDVLRLREREHLAEPHAAPLDVLHRPAGDAVERRDLLDLRQRAQLAIVDRRRRLDMPAQ